MSYKYFKPLLLFIAYFFRVSSRDLLSFRRKGDLHIPWYRTIHRVHVLWMVGWWYTWIDAHITCINDAYWCPEHWSRRQNGGVLVWLFGCIFVDAFGELLLVGPSDAFIPIVVQYHPEGRQDLHFEILGELLHESMNLPFRTGLFDPNN